MFKSPIFLLFSKQHKTPTKTGAFFSLAIMIFLSIISFRSDLFQKNSPTLLFSELPQSKREKVDLTKKILGFGLQNEIGLALMDPNAFTIEVKHGIRNEGTNFDVIEKQIQIHECSEQDFDNPNVFHELTLGKNYCLPKNESLFLQGYWDESDLAYLMISLKYCRNETSNGTCKTQEEIEDTFASKNFNIYLEDTIIDIYDYKSPIKKTIRNEYKSVDLIFNKILEIDMQNVYVYSDDGILTEKIDSYLEVKYNYQIFDFFTKKKNADDSTIFTFEIYASKNVLKFNRSYQKLFDLLGIIGGIYEILKIIGLACVQFEFNLLIKRKIMNLLFTVPESCFPKELKTKKIYVKSDISNLSNSQNTKGKIGLKKKFSFTILEYLQLQVKKIMKARLNVKEQYFVKGEEKFKKKIELTKVLTQLQQIKFMKDILLTRDQIKLLKHMQKPDLKMKPTYDKFQKNIELRRTLEKMETLKVQNKLNETDIKILSSLDHKFGPNDLIEKSGVFKKLESTKK